MRPLVLLATLTHLLIAAACADEATMPSPSDGPSTAQDGLWTVSGSSSAILRLEPTRLSDTADGDPSTIITTPSTPLETLAAVAFDAAGNLWIAGIDESVLLAFEPNALKSSGSRLARTAIALSAGSIRFPTGLAFDAQQHLWVADHASRTLNRFDAQQLETGGALSPAVVLHIPESATAIAFDASGSLWVSDNVSNVVSKYTAAKLATSGSPVPDVVLSANESSLLNPTGLAFDADGNLWVVNTGGRTLAGFAPGQLTRTGSPAPRVLITSNDGALSVPVGLAFDGSRDLWVVGGTGALTKFSHESLGASGAPMPSLRLQIADRSLFWGIAFWPIPSGLPLGSRAR